MEFTKTMIIFSFIMMATMWSSMAEVYDVGDSNGWALKVDYKEWSSNKKFAVGDILVFNYDGATDNVLLVTKEEFKCCASKSPIALYNSGKDLIYLSDVGRYYFISGVPAKCEAGEKLKIKVRSSIDHNRNCQKEKDESASTSLTSNCVLGLTFILATYFCFLLN